LPWCSAAILLKLQELTLTMTEIAMNEYYVDSDVRAGYIRQAEEMRRQYIRASFVKAGSALTRSAAWAWGKIRAVGRRSRWNLSVPAPHR
jgi:hypothetical protein